LGDLSILGHQLLQELEILIPHGQLEALVQALGAALKPLERLLHDRWLLGRFSL